MFFCQTLSKQFYERRPIRPSSRCGSAVQPQDQPQERLFVSAGVDAVPGVFRFAESAMGSAGFAVSNPGNCISLTGVCRLGDVIIVLFSNM